MGILDNLIGVTAGNDYSQRMSSAYTDQSSQQTTSNYDIAYNINISSPNSTITSKKQASAPQVSNNPVSTPTQSMSQPQTSLNTGGITNVLIIAGIIGLVVLTK